MEFKDVIMNRRSARVFNHKPVSNDQIANILDMCRYTPSAGNIQNWMVIIIRDDEKKKSVGRACVNQSWLTKAPVLLVVCNELTNIQAVFRERGIRLYSRQNCAAFIQNILLAAHSIGLSTCWVGAFDDQAMRSILKIPEGVEVEAVIPLGYSDVKGTAPKRHSLKSFCFFEEWGNKDITFEYKSELETPVQKSLSFLEKIKEKFLKK